MSVAQKDTIAFIGKWLISILIAATGFVLSTSYLSMKEDIKSQGSEMKEQGKMMQDINSRLIRVETKLENK